MGDEILAQFAELLPVGFCCGFLAGAFGIGGGTITVPLLRNLLGVSAHIAVGSSLLVIVPTSLTAAINYFRRERLMPKAAISCALPAIAGTVLSSALSHYLPGKILMLVLAVMMNLIGLDCISGFSERLLEQAKGANAAPEGENIILKKAAIIGFPVGLISGLVGIGGGFILVPAFSHFLKMPLKTCFGTSLAVIAMTTLPGAIVHSIHGHTELSISIPLMTASLPGAWLGSRFSLRAREGFLKTCFGWLLICAAEIVACKELFAA